MDAKEIEKDINYWNKKLYRDEEGKSLPGQWTNEDFYSKFGIRSWPLYEKAYACHLPSPWNEDVEKLLNEIKNKYKALVTIQQIKEKWANLTIYYDILSDGSEREVIFKEVNKMINDTKDILRAKGLHP